MLSAAGTHLKVNGQLKSSSSKKYLEVVKNLFPPEELKIKKIVKRTKPFYANITSRYKEKTDDEKSGEGLMTLNKKKIEYVYFDSINEIIDRLE